MTSKWHVAWGVLLVSLSMASAQAYKEDEKGKKCPVYGGEVPVPYDANQTVELANGSIYLLKGKILPGYVKNRPFLEVDLKTHKWLANRDRVEFPYYGIDMPKKFHESVNDFYYAEVLIKVRARAFVAQPSHAEPYYAIRLTLLEEPRSAKGCK